MKRLNRQVIILMKKIIILKLSYLLEYRLDISLYKHYSRVMIICCFFLNLRKKKFDMIQHNQILSNFYLLILNKTVFLCQ